MTTPPTPPHHPSCHLQQPHDERSTCLSEMAHGCTCPPTPSLEQEGRQLIHVQQCSRHPVTLGTE